jgi:hypothetical protein
VTTIEVELLTDPGNGAVIRLPERKFPGVLVQGDTLNGFVALLAEATRSLSCGDVGEAQGILQSLAAELKDLRARYEGTLKDHGVGLPY